MHINKPHSPSATPGRWVLCLTFAALSLVGCVHRNPETGNGDAPPPDQGSDLSEVERIFLDDAFVAREPMIAAGMELSISVRAGTRPVVNERNLRVGSDGIVVLPITGELDLADLTLQQAREALRLSYSQYVKQPEIRVDFAPHAENGLSPWGHVMVLGEVGTPGKINIPPTRFLTLSMAIQQAGGLEKNARTSDIEVSRYLKEREVVSISVNLYGDMANGLPAGKLRLRDGDVIRISERIF